MKVVIITGLSGAGRSKAANWFEDQGYYCIDNMPPQLVKNFLELAEQVSGIEKVALVADIRVEEFFSELEFCIKELKKDPAIELSVLFMEASTETIVRRYNETRRNHPLTDGKANIKTIETEREMLTGLRKLSDYVVDTTGLKGAGLEHELARIFLGDEAETAFSINVTSFGFKYGIPPESDLVFDMRFIPNPFYVKSLKKLTGNNKRIRDYVMKYEITQNFIKQLDEMVNALIPGYINEGKYHLNIAFGCTGGHHRSVAMANEMSRIFTEEGHRVTLVHRDLDFIAKR